MLEHKRLCILLGYLPESGYFLWKVRPRPQTRIGDIAGCINSSGYWQIGIDGKLYYGHSLAWFYMTGEWPDFQIDHKNTQPSDNSWDNLRPATQTQNNGNQKLNSRNTSGIKGVYFDKRTHQWRAGISVNNKTVNLGRFNTLEQAAYARRQAAEHYFGEFVNQQHP